jgi:uncharacterized protein (TIGR00290 family)
VTAGPARAPMERILLSWSSGKDSAWSLHVLRQSQRYEIVGLLTTVSGRDDRVAMHGVRRELLEAQAAAAGIPLWDVTIPWPCPNEAYESILGREMAKAKERGITAVAFGDLYLEEIRAYRESKLSGTGIAPIFPIWGRPTRALAEEMIGAGLRARLVCVDTKQLDARFAGRELDARLLAELPAGVDPCGEGGEFHTFCWDGPMFARPIEVSAGAVVEAEGFARVDVMLAARGALEAQR